MVLVRFSSNPLDRSDIKEYGSYAKTVRGIFAEIPANISGDEPFVRTFINDEEVGLDHELGDDDEVFVVIDPGSEAVVLFVIQVVIAVAGILVSRSMMRTPDKTSDRDDNSSPTYNFSGISQTRTDHQPVEFTGGKIRVGGTVIAEFIESSYAPVTSTLHQLVSFGWGEFESIAGLTEDTPEGTKIAGATLGVELFINDNPVENYDDVEVQVRLGTPNQKPLLGFEKVNEVYEVGPFELTAPEVDGELNSAAGAGWDDAKWDTTDNDAYWDEYGQTFDVTNSADEIALRLTAPQGYYSSNASGGLALSEFKYAVRYQELDGSNNPITTGGPTSDGWYREQPNSGSTFPAFSQQGSFDYQINAPLYDPQQATQFATSSNCYTFDMADTAQHAVSASLPGVAVIGDFYPLGGQEYPTTTISFWFRVRDASLFTGITGTKETYIIGQGRSGGSGGLGGWSITMRVNTSSQVMEEGNNRDTDIHLEARMWDGVTGAEFSSFGTQIYHTEYRYLDDGNGLEVTQLDDEFSDTWRFVAVRMSGDPGGVHSNIYYNGHFRHFNLGASSAPPVWSGEGVSIGHSDVEPTLIANDLVGTLDIDQVRFFDGDVSASAIVSMASENSGLSIQGSVKENSLWTLELSPSPNSNVPQHVGDPQWFGDMTLAGGGSVLTDGGAIPDTTGIGDRKRMKVRVEVVRTNVDSTNTRTQDTMEWRQVRGVTDAKLTHPGKALMAISIRASEQLGGRIPNITTVVKGFKPIVGYGPLAARRWTANPAWLCRELIENRHWGLPGNYTADEEQITEMSEYFDETVYDGTKVFKSDGEADHDFSYNLWFDANEQDEDGEDRGAITIHIPYLSQVTGETLNSALPVEWVPGHFIKLSGWPGISAQVDFDINSLEGYEIFEVGVGVSFSGVTHTPGHHYVKAYFKPKGALGGVPLFILSFPPATDGSATGSLGVQAGEPGGVIPLGATVEGREKRFSFNGTFDRSGGGWDSLQKICTVARMAPYRVGKKIRFRYSHPTDPVFMVTQSSILAGTFKMSYTAISGRLNAFDLLIRDERHRYDTATVSYVDPTINNETNANIVHREQRELFGVTSPSQALRYGVYETNVNRLIVREGEFVVGVSGISYEVGDVFRIASGLIPKGRGQGGFSLHSSESQLLTDSDDLTAWTTSSVAVASEVVADDVTATAGTFAVTDSSGLAYGYIEAETTQLLPGVYCVGVQCRWSSGDTITRVELTSMENGDVSFWAEIDLSDGSVSATKTDGDGEVTVTDIGSGTYYIYLWSKYIQSSSTDTLAVRLYPAASAKVATGTTSYSTVSLAEGKHPSFAHTIGHAVCIERETVLDASELCWGISGGGSLTSASGILNPAGTYTSGQTIFFSSPFSSDPSRPGQYSFVDPTDGGMVAEIVGIELGENLTNKISWIEYNEDVFNDRSTDLTAVEESIFDDDHGGMSNEVTLNRVPDRVSITGAQDMSVMSVSGTVSTNVRVWWTPVVRDTFLVAGTEIWGRIGSGGRWNMLGMAHGADGYADVPLTMGSIGDQVQIAIRPVSAGGHKRQVENCGRVEIAIRGYRTIPEPVSSAATRVAGRRALHSWQTTGFDRQTSVECRRGGWILGDPVFIAPQGAGKVGPSENWVGSDFGTVQLQYRAMSVSGAFSNHLLNEVTTVIEQDPKAPETTKQTRAWESHADVDGWVAAVPGPNSPVISTEFEQRADGSLRYTSSSTETTSDVVLWTSAKSDVVPVSGKVYKEARNVYVEAYFDAIQIAPNDWDADEQFSSYDATRRSFEGVVTLLSGEGQSTLRCQINVNETGVDDDWSGWMDYQPGEYSVVDIRFRLVATRPNANYNISVRKMHTRVTAKAGSLDESTPERRTLESEIF